MKIDYENVKILSSTEYWKLQKDKVSHVKKLKNKFGVHGSIDIFLKIAILNGWIVKTWNTNIERSWKRERQYCRFFAFQMLFVRVILRY